MHCHKFIEILFLTLLLVFNDLAAAGDLSLRAPHQNSRSALSLDPIEIPCQGGHVLFERKTNHPYTETSLTRDAIESLSGATQGSPLQAIRTLPSVQVNSEEPYGYGNFFTSGVKIRGQRIKAPASNLLIEGLQVTGAPGGNQYLFDLENVENISVSKGAVPPAKSLAFAAGAGLIDYRLRRPEQDAGAQFEQSLGSFDYQRSFLRLDSGQLPGTVRLFASYSYTDADKWRGSGQSPDWRHNLDIGLVKEFGQWATLEVFGNLLSFKAHDFRSLSYAQTRDLGRYRKSHFNSSLTGNPAEDIHYYDFNHRRFDGYTLMADLKIRLTEKSRFSVRPYFNKDQGYWMTGVIERNTPVIRKWEINHHKLGVVAQYETVTPLVDLIAGYWYHEQERPGPPNEWKTFTVAPDGGLDFQGWSVLSDNDKHVIHSPYLQLNRRFGPLSMTGGARYHYMEFAEIKSYIHVNGDKTYDPWSSVGRKFTDKVLPFAAVNYSFGDSADIYFAYGRNVGRTAFPLYPSYSTRRARFVSAGVRLEDLWRNVELETSDHCDLGARLDFGRWYLHPVLFHARHFHKAVDVFDPISGLLVNQNIAKARSYGAELEAGFHLTDNLLLAFNGYYNNFEFEEDIRNSIGENLQVKGNQISDTPQFGANLTADYRLGGFSITPVVRYTGRRYGDALNEEPLDAFWLVDLNMAYRLKNLWHLRETKFSLSFLNLFDKKYIGAMDAADDTRPGQMSYYPGAPFTMVFTISGRI